MDMKQIEETMKLIPKFIQTVENDLGEDNHTIEGKPFTYKQFEQIQQLATKLNNCISFVDVTIFK